jgi:hypothetical protein
VYYAMFTAVSVGSVGFVFREFSCFDSAQSAGIFCGGLVLAAGGVFLVQLKARGSEDAAESADDKHSRSEADAEEQHPPAPLPCTAKVPTFDCLPTIEDDADEQDGWASSKLTIQRDSSTGEADQADDVELGQQSVLGALRSEQVMPPRRPAASHTPSGAVSRPPHRA